MTLANSQLEVSAGNLKFPTDVPVQNIPLKCENLFSET